MDITERHDLHCHRSFSGVPLAGQLALRVQCIGDLQEGQMPPYLMHMFTVVDTCNEGPVAREPPSSGGGQRSYPKCPFSVATVYR
jgi:hypothetical protein